MKYAKSLRTATYIQNPTVKNAGQSSIAAVVATLTTGNMSMTFANLIKFPVNWRKSVWNVLL